MRTTSEKVSEIIEQSPYLREALSDGLINLSALARKIQPQVAEEMMRDVSESAIFSSLQRMASNIEPFYALNPKHYLDNLSLTSNLVSLSLAISPTLGHEIRKINDLSAQKRFFFISSYFENEATLAFPQTEINDVEAILAKEETNHKVEDISALVMNRGVDWVKNPGILYYPLQQLAMEGISVVHIFTTRFKLFVYINDVDVDKAFTILRRAITED